MEGKISLSRKNSFYLYGILRNRPVDLSEVRGIEGKQDVKLVRFRELAAAASLVPLSLYNEESLMARVQEMEWITARAARHQEIIDQLMASGAVIPLKFATLCLNRAGVQKLLEKHYERLLSLLEFVNGCQEWGIKVYLDEGMVTQAIEEANSEVRAMDKKISSASVGEAYFLEKKKRELVHEHQDHLLTELADDIYQYLRTQAVDARRNRLFNSPSGLMILNVAFLVEQQEFGSLKAKAEEVEARFRGYGVNLELSGPWAPYSFCEDLTTTSLEKGFDRPSNRA